MKTHVSLHGFLGPGEKGVCNAEQDSASGCRSKECLWREVLALSMETWVICIAGTWKPLRAALCRETGMGAAVSGV